MPAHWPSLHCRLYSGRVVRLDIDGDHTLVTVVDAHQHAHRPRPSPPSPVKLIRARPRLSGGDHKLTSFAPKQLKPYIIHTSTILRYTHNSLLPYQLLPFTRHLPQMAKKNAAAGPSKPAAAPAKPKAKAAPKAKAPAGKKRAAAKDTTVDTVSPTSTESTVIPSPAKRRKTSAPLNSSQQTDTSTGKYSTPYVNGRPWYDFSDINRQLNVGTGDDIEHVKIVSAPVAVAPGKSKKGTKLGKGSSSATMVAQMGEEESDSDIPLSDPPEDEDMEDAYVAPETRSPTPGPSKPDFVPKILPLRYVGASFGTH